MRVSTYKNKITPTGEFFPCYLSGHAIRHQLADGVIDELWTTVLLLQQDTTLLVWITIDLIGLNRDWTNHLKHTIASKYNIPNSNINIAFIHTHAAPEYEKVNFFGGAGVVNGYMDFVFSQTMNAVDNAFETEFTEVNAYSKKIEIAGCYGNRNGISKPSDKIFQTVEFRNGEKVIAGFFVIACHSTVLGPQNLKVSSDLAGHIAQQLYHRWGIYPITMIGAAGDMSNRFYRKGNDIDELNRITKDIMEQYDTITNDEKPEIKKCKINTWVFSETYYPNAIEKQQQYNKILNIVNNAKSFDEKKVYTSALAIAKKGLELKPFHLLLECTLIDFGEIRIFTIPAELFARFGIEIKNAMNCKCPVLWGYSNYNVGYLGNREDYGDSFETASSDIPMGTSEVIVKQIIEFINQNKEE